MEKAKCAIERSEIAEGLREGETTRHKEPSCDIIGLKMKKAFTLVELLVVVVVLVILMTMVFKLSSVGGDSAAVSTTVDRMHRLENALSGYYAAFGTYPPVKLHSSRNPYLAVNDHGDQSQKGDENSSIWDWIDSDGVKVTNSEKERDAWTQVQAACVAQPVACMFPFPKDVMKEAVDTMNKKMKLAAEKMEDGQEKRIFERGFDDGVSENIARFNPYEDVSDWSVVKLFRFGLMSFLLPRYLVMMTSESDFFDYAQWTGNNTLPRDPLTGSQISSWSYMQKNYIQGTASSDLAHVANVPSQAVCARWMANFDRSLACNYDLVLFGVNLRGGTGDEGFLSNLKSSDIFIPGGYEHGDTSAQYVLDKISICDGWGNDFYYYSPAPYQSYILWSAGPNGRTFPPWIARENLDGNANRCIGYWVRDDIVNLSH